MNKLLVPALCALTFACGSNPTADSGSAATSEPRAAAPEASSKEDVADGRVNYQRVAYPGSQIGSGNPVTFTTSAPIDKVMEWYRDDARRSEGLMVSSERKDDGYLALGTLIADDGGKSFTLLINSTTSGGTEGKFLRADWLTTGQKL